MTTTYPMKDAINDNNIPYERCDVVHEREANIFYFKLGKMVTGVFGFLDIVDNHLVPIGAITYNGKVLDEEEKELFIQALRDHFTK
jgi:hypothetical protein